MASGWLQGRLLNILKKHESFTDGYLMANHERQRPAEGALPFWGHLFVLGGIDSRFFGSFKKRLNELIQETDVVTEDTIARLGLDALKSIDAVKGFSPIAKGRSDLSHQWLDAVFLRDRKGFIERVIDDEAIVELRYRNRRGEDSIRHVRPLKAQESYFQAKSHLGVRNYRYDQVQWVSTLESREEFLHPPYAVYVSMDNSDFKRSGTKIRVVYGALVDGGLELNIPQGSHPEDKDTSLFYAMEY